MIKCSKQPTDPFLVTGERWVDHRVLQRAMEEKRDHFELYFSTTKHNRVDSIGKWTFDDMTPISGTRDEIEWKKFRNRLGMAAFGGFFLLAPMWLMVKHRTLYTALVSTTAFVAVFGFIMAAQGQIDVLSSTAAYAAVLVVLVGLNTQPLSG